MSHLITAVISVAMTVSFFYGSAGIGMWLAVVLLIYLLRHAPKELYTDTKKDADNDTVDASETN